MGIFNQLFKALYDSSAGRIHWRSNMWALIGSRWDRKRLVNKNLIGSSRVNDKGEWQGETVTLVNRLCTSSCPNPPGPDFYEDNGKYYVPATECRKCPYYRKADKQFRFPRCTFGKESEVKSIQSDAANKFVDILEQTEEKTNQILDGYRGFYDKE